MENKIPVGEATPVETQEQKKARWAEELKQKEEEQKKLDARPDIVLEIRVNSKGDINWIMPKDMRVTCYLLRVLELGVNGELNKNLLATLKKPSIISKIGGIFK